MCVSYYALMPHPQHGTADVSLMLLGSKLDLEGRREITLEEGKKVGGAPWGQGSQSQVES